MVERKGEINGGWAAEQNGVSPKKLLLPTFNLTATKRKELDQLRRDLRADAARLRGRPDNDPLYGEIAYKTEQIYSLQNSGRLRMAAKEKGKYRESWGLRDNEPSDDRKENERRGLQLRIYNRRLALNRVTPVNDSIDLDHYINALQGMMSAEEDLENLEPRLRLIPEAGPDLRPSAANETPANDTPETKEERRATMLDRAVTIKEVTEQIETIEEKMKHLSPGPALQHAEKERKELQNTLETLGWGLEKLREDDWYHGGDLGMHLYRDTASIIGAPSGASLKPLPQRNWALRADSLMNKIKGAYDGVSGPRPSRKRKRDPRLGNHGMSVAVDVEDGDDDDELQSLPNNPSDGRAEQTAKRRYNPSDRRAEETAKKREEWGRKLRAEIKRHEVLESEIDLERRRSKKAGDTETAMGKSNLERLNIISERVSWSRKARQQELHGMQFGEIKDPLDFWEDRHGGKLAWRPVYQGETRAMWKEMILGNHRWEGLNIYLGERAKGSALPLQNMTGVEDDEGQTVFPEAQVLTYSIKFNFRMKLGDMSKDQAIARVQDILDDVGGGPYYVHCAHDGCTCLPVLQSLARVYINYNEDVQLVRKIDGNDIRMLDLWHAFQSEYNIVYGQRATKKPDAMGFWGRLAYRLGLRFTPAAHAELERVCNRYLLPVRTAGNMVRPLRTRALIISDAIPLRARKSRKKTQANRNAMTWSVEEDRDIFPNQVPNNWMFIKVHSAVFDASSGMGTGPLKVIGNALQALDNGLDEKSNDSELCHTMVRIGVRDRQYTIEDLRALAGVFYALEPELLLLVKPHWIGSQAKPVRTHAPIRHESPSDGFRKIFECPDLDDLSRLVNNTATSCGPENRKRVLNLVDFSSASQFLRFRHMEGTFNGRDVTLWIYFLLSLVGTVMEKPEPWKDTMERKIDRYGEALEDKRWNELSQQELERKIRKLQIVAVQAQANELDKGWFMDRYRRTHHDDIEMD